MEVEVEVMMVEVVRDVEEGMTILISIFHSSLSLSLSHHVQAGNQATYESQKPQGERSCGECLRREFGDGEAL